MPSSLLESLCRESTGADLARSQAFLDFLADHLAAPDYATAVAMLWAAVDPVESARQQRTAA